MFKLVGNNHACSGVQVHAGSGQDYLLTAGHCNVLADDNGSIGVILDNGDHLQRRIIEEDANSDLLLLEGVPNLHGVEVSKALEPSAHITAFTHRKGMATSKSEGAVIESQRVAAPVSEISSEGDEEACLSKLKQSVVAVDFLGVVTIKFCVLVVDENVTTLPISPGSSGGMVVNENGDLVGIVSMGDGEFSYIVLLKDIQAFIKAY